LWNQLSTLSWQIGSSSRSPNGEDDWLFDHQRCKVGGAMGWMRPINGCERGGT